jgi:hypothetical protein
MRNLFALICFASLLVISLDARAELRGKDRKEAGKMVYATIYLRTDVPTNDAVEPFVEVSPSGYSWERLVNQAEEKAKRKNKPSGVYYPFRPNDIVKWGSVSYDHDTITVWFQGILDELKVRFVQINTLDDFQKAFDHLFSRVPLQDEHSDWPAEVKSAIADRRVVESMTKEQASCVVGTPLKTDTTKEGEASVEVWYLRQDTGDTRGGKHRASTGLPKSLKFVNDKLTAIDK